MSAPHTPEGCASVARDLITLGWREWVALPELGIERIKAKVDTGARTSALHAFYVERLRQAGRERVRFRVHPFQRREDVWVECLTDVLDDRVVSDSGGHRERRIVIRTAACVGEACWPIELSLTARDSMRFRMLLGRTAIRAHFLVDPGSAYLSGKPRAPRFTAATYHKNTTRGHP